MGRRDIMFSAEQYIQHIEALTPGVERTRALKEAIAAADEAKATEWQFVFRHRYISASIFESDNFDAMVVFPEMLAIYDTHPELEMEYQPDLMWDFKYILGIAIDYPQVPMAQIEALYGDFRQRCKTYGYSLRPYYYLREKRLLRTGVPLTEVPLGAYRQEPEDALKDCKACEQAHDLNVALYLDDLQTAEEKFKPLEDGTMQCAEEPEYAFARWLHYDCARGRYDHAKPLAKRLAPMLRSKVDMLGELGALLRFDAQVDRHAGCNVVQRSLKDFLDCRNPWMRLQYAEGAYRVFAQMQMEEISLVLPRNFPLYQENHRYRSADLRDYFYQIASDLAARFDQRNGNTQCTDALHHVDPPYDKTAVDFVHGDAEQTFSVMGGVCPKLPETLTLESVTARLKQDGRFAVEMTHAEPENNVLHLALTQEEAVYAVAIAVEQTPQLDSFRPMGPVRNDDLEAAKTAEGTVLCMLWFADHPFDQALQVQLQLLRLLCPNAAVYLDYSRGRLFPAGWVALQAESRVLPMVDYLYQLQLNGSDADDSVHIVTNGMNCCGMREIEIFDANKENFRRYADLLCYVTERLLLRGFMPDAATPILAVRMADGSQLTCAWLPAVQAMEYYPAEAAGACNLRREMLADDWNVWDDHAVLFLYEGEQADGTPKLRRLDTLTEADFENFRYGSYIATDRKIKEMAQERFGSLVKAFPESDEAYVRLAVETTENHDIIWAQLEEIDGDMLTVTLLEDEIIGQKGETYQAHRQQMLDFAVHAGGFRIAPNFAYLAEACGQETEIDP